MYILSNNSIQSFLVYVKEERAMLELPNRSAEAWKTDLITFLIERKAATFRWYVKYQSFLHYDAADPVLVVPFKYLGCTLVPWVENGIRAWADDLSGVLTPEDHHIVLICEIEREQTGGFKVLFEF